MIDYTLGLDYQLAAGWMAPFVRGLLDGQAIARRCIACGNTSYPPVRVCECGEVDGEWIQLPGSARLVHRTVGADGDFGLVCFDGANTQTVVSLVGFSESQSIGKLHKPTKPHPALILHALETDGML